MPELSGKEPLILSLQLVADIYLGHITYWNDSAIAELNPHLKDYLPNKALLVAYEPGSSVTGGKVAKVLSIIPEFNSTVSMNSFQRSLNAVFSIQLCCSSTKTHIQTLLQ